MFPKMGLIKKAKSCKKKDKQLLKWQLSSIYLPSITYIIQLSLLKHQNAEQVLNSWMMTHPPLTQVGPPAAADKT